MKAGFLGALGCLVGITGGGCGHQPSALGTAFAIYKRRSIRDTIEESEFAQGGNLGLRSVLGELRCI